MKGQKAFSGLPDTCVVSAQGISTPLLGLTTSKNILLVSLGAS